MYFFLSEKYIMEMLFNRGDLFLPGILVCQTTSGSDILSALVTFVKRHILLIELELFWSPQDIIFEWRVFLGYLWLLSTLWVDGRRLYFVGFLFDLIFVALVWYCFGSFPLNWITFTWTILPSCRTAHHQRRFPTQYPFNHLKGDSIWIDLPTWVWIRRSSWEMSNGFVIIFDLQKPNLYYCPGWNDYSM